MKKIFGVFLLALALSLVMTSCGPALPSPAVEEGEFDVSVTYEVNGDAKTLDLVYTCKYEGTAWSLEGASYRDWRGHFKGYGDGDVIEVASTEDGGKIVLCFLIYAEYFMGEPEYIQDFYPVVLTNYIYYEDNVEMIEDDQELIATEYNVKILGIEYDEPIQNTFG